jgi:hypothetical protein
MYLLFEEAGKFMAGRVLSEADTSAQVELESGKRVKVKGANMLLKFEKPAPAALLAQAQALSQEIELELAWEFSPEDEFGFAELARDYFSANATLEQQVAMLLRLFEAPHYFRRAGKGRFRKAPAEVIAQALAAIEKKKQLALQIEQWVQQLSAGECPAPVREQLYKILFKPDKNAPEYKAVVEASRATQLGVLELLQRAGAIDSPYQFHWRRFLLENFPRGTGFAPAHDDTPPAPDSRMTAHVPTTSMSVAVHPPWSVRNRLSFESPSGRRATTLPAAASVETRVRPARACSSNLPNARAPCGTSAPTTLARKAPTATRDQPMPEAGSRRKKGRVTSNHMSREAKRRKRAPDRTPTRLFTVNAALSVTPLPSGERPRPGSSARAAHGYAQRMTAAINPTAA